MTDDDAYLGKKRTVPAGNIHMNGEVAAWYVRSRYSTSDFDRARRQQEVLQALLNRLLVPSSLEHAPEVYNTLRKSVITNLTLENVASWIPLALQMKKTNRLKQYVIGRAQTTDFTVPTDNAKVLLPNYAAISSIMRQAVTP
jgi:anionic cell wall polymer biosynthesis LytR-Cps2A-Psr (LCP) family protein